jgi:hypothetical protein
MTYVAFDADDVGAMIERLILEEDLETLTAVSEQIHKAVQLIARRFETLSGQVIFANGDGGLIRLADEIGGEELCAIFTEYGAQMTFSVGLAKTPREAWLALKYAKTNKPGMVWFRDGEFYRRPNSW